MRNNQVKPARYSLTAQQVQQIRARASKPLRAYAPETLQEIRDLCDEWLRGKTFRRRVLSVFYTLWFGERVPRSRKRARKASQEQTPAGFIDDPLPKPDKICSCGREEWFCIPDSLSQACPGCWQVRVGFEEPYEKGRISLFEWVDRARGSSVLRSLSELLMMVKDMPKTEQNDKAFAALAKRLIG